LLVDVFRDPLAFESPAVGVGSSSSTHAALSCSTTSTTSGIASYSARSERAA
jgi:hypothetical protein